MPFLRCNSVRVFNTDYVYKNIIFQVSFYWLLLIFQWQCQCYSFYLKKYTSTVIPPPLFAASISAVWKRVVGQGLGTKLSESPITENTMVGVELIFTALFLFSYNWFVWFSILLSLIFGFLVVFTSSLMFFHNASTSIVLLKYKIKQHPDQFSFTLWPLKGLTIAEKGWYVHVLVFNNDMKNNQIMIWYHLS